MWFHGHETNSILTCDRVDYESGVLGQFKLGFCAYIGFYIIVDAFLSRVNSRSLVTRSGEYRIIGSVLYTYNHYRTVKVEYSRSLCPLYI